MIIDCHAHVFQNWHGACGHPSIDVHLKYIQKNVTRPAAEAFRVRDGMRVKPGMLFRDGDNTWTGLKDVGFRIGRRVQRSSKDTWEQANPGHVRASISLLTTTAGFRPHGCRGCRGRHNSRHSKLGNNCHSRLGPQPALAARLTLWDHQCAAS